MAAQNSHKEISRTSLADWEKGPPKHNETAEDSSDRESRGKEPIDEGARLRMLGYDAVLGRPLGFWSSAAMNFCHMSFFFEFLANTTSLAHFGPLVFLIGYPIAAVFQLILMGPFCEMVSAFPVAGAMATWSWQCARKGIRHERQWGYLVGGVVLTMHMAKIIFFMYNFSVSIEGLLYDSAVLDPLITKGVKVIAYVVLLTVVGILCLTRLSQNHIYWIIAAAVNIGWFVVGLTFILLGAPKIEKFQKAFGFLDGMKRDWGFSEAVRANWRHPISWMIFVALPLRVTAIDASAHMSEETKNPSKSVPRAMYSSAIAHHVLTYILTAAYVVTNGSLVFRQESAALEGEFITGFAANANAWMMVDQPFNSALKGPIIQFVAFGWIGCTQVAAAVTITSRFIFALARENGIPFSYFLVKTDKHQMPWVAMVVIICSLYISTAGMFVNIGNYYNLIQSTAVSLINIAYGIPLFLYITTKINFARDERSQFSLRGLGKPFAVISLGYLIVATVQGSMPISMYNNREVYPHLKADTLSAFPIVLPVLLVIIFLSWWIYGRNHYIGPIRGLTKWSTGVEVDPLALDPSKHKHEALRRFVNVALGETSSGGSITRVGGWTSKSKGTSSGTPSGTGSNGKSPMSAKFFGFRSGGYSKTLSNPNSPLSPNTKGIATFETHSKSQLLLSATTTGALPESALLPGQTMNPALAESSLMPERTIPVAEPAKVDLLLPPKEAKLAGWGRKIMSRASMFKAKEDESVALGDESVTLRSHGGEAALPESQLDYQSRFNPAASAALQESQLFPTTRHEPAALEESQLYHQTQHQPAAMEESQLYHETQHAPAALEEFMIDPTQTSLSAFGCGR